MSGICGIIESKNGHPVDGLIENMTETLKHRGPHGEIIYANGHVGFGTRLMNIFGTLISKKPITNETQTILLFADGEIYNFRELQNRLISKGHQLNGQGDTEVIVHLYEEYGEKCVDKLRGVFAFAIWDAQKQKLLLYRDRMGVKPLFYTKIGETFLFGSEMKALLKCDQIEKKLNYEALDHYLNFRLIPEPKTIFKNIFKLPAGHRLTYQNGNIKIEPYWDINYIETHVKTPQEYQQALLEKLSEAIKIRMMGDVPFGSYLSGGMDSSSIVSLLSKMIDRKLPTFSIAFNEPEYDERKYQRIVAKYCNTDHHEFVVQMETVEELLPKLLRYFDQPFGDSSALPAYYLARETRKYVQYVFTGDGGDELLAGYTTYPGMLHSENFRKLPGFISKGLIPGAVNLAGLVLPAKYAYKIERCKKFFKDAILPFEQRYMTKIEIASKELREKLYNEATRKKIAKNNEQIVLQHFEKTKGKHPLNRVNYTDIWFRFENTILPKTERTCIANSLIARNPYLDYKLVEFAASVPPHLKLKGLKTKYLLHLAMHNKLPKAIHAKTKHGFVPPLTIWFKNDLKPYMKNMLLSHDSRILNYFNKNEVEKVIQIHNSGKINLGEHLWGLLGFEAWHRMYLG